MAAAAQKITVPTRLNGYPVIEYDRHDNCVTIMVERDGGHERHERYVVATWWPELGLSWSWGRYCQTVKEAKSQFFAASERNKRR